MPEVESTETIEVTQESLLAEIVALQTALEEAAELGAEATEYLEDIQSHIRSAPLRMLLGTMRRLSERLESLGSAVDDAVASAECLVEAEAAAESEAEA